MHQSEHHAGRGKRVAFGLAAAVLGITIGLYAAETVFRFVVLVPSIPASEADFRRLVSDGWPRPVATEKQAGTIRVLGLADVTGSLRPGIAADLLIVAGDPLSDLAALEARVAVFARGRGIDLE